MKSALLIDDDQIFNFLNKRILTRLNLFDKVYVCVSVNEGIELMNELKGKESILPSLILLDIKLPGKSGFEFLDQINRMYTDERSQPKVAMLTSSLDPADKEKAYRNQFVGDFIEKPLHEDKILQLIREN